MIVVAALALAAACMAVALLLLRSVGPGYRVGRILAVAPLVQIADARAMAGGAPSYVRVTGRITSDEEFPDENERPLVYRRKRIQIGDGRGGWRTIGDEREAVAFGVETRGSFIAVDESAIDRGLIAIPRESAGTLSDLPPDMLAGIDDLPPAATPARLVIEQLSAVEHATVCGTPVLRNGQPTMTAGTNRPLIVTILDAPAAMRLLAAGSRRRVAAATGLLAAAVLLVFVSGAAAVLGL